MKGGSEVKPAPFYRKTAQMPSNPEHDLSSPALLQYEQDGASSSASARKFLRRQRNDQAASRPGERSRLDVGSVLQFVTNKKLQELRMNASCLSPESHRLFTQLQDQLSPEKMNHSPQTHLERYRHQRVLTNNGVGLHSQKNLHNDTTLPSFGSTFPQVQTSGLSSPSSEKKIIDYRTRPGTPHKEDIRIPNHNSEGAKINLSVSSVKQSREPKDVRQDRRVKILETRITELEQLLEQTDSYRQRCDELEAKLSRSTSIAQNSSEKVTKLLQENEKKQLEIDLLRQQLSNPAQTPKKPPLSSRPKLKQQSSLTSKKIVESEQYQALEAQNAKIKKELETVRSSLSRIEMENAKLKRTNKTLQGRIVEIENSQRQAMKEELKRATSEKQKRMEEQLAMIKEQLQVALHANSSTLLEQLVTSQNELLRTKKQLDYYHMMVYCVKRQLHQTRDEVSQRVPSAEYNELKTKFKNVSKKLREMVLHKNRRSSEEFELTPEKSHQSEITAHY